MSAPANTNGSVYKIEPLFKPEQVTGMVLAEVKANIKDQYDRSAEIERRYDGLITDAEDEHRVKQHLLTVDLLIDHEKKLEEALERKHRVNSGLEEYSRPSNGMRQPSGGDPINWRADQSWRPVHSLCRVRAVAQGRSVRQLTEPS